MNDTDDKKQSGCAGNGLVYGMQNRNVIAHLLSVTDLNDEQREAILGGTLATLLKLDKA